MKQCLLHDGGAQSVDQIIGKLSAIYNRLLGKNDFWVLGILYYIAQIYFKILMSIKVLVSLKNS